MCDESVREINECERSECVCVCDESVCVMNVCVWIVEVARLLVLRL